MGYFHNDYLYFQAIVVPTLCAGEFISYRRARHQLDKWAESNHFQLSRVNYVALPIPWLPLFWKLVRKNRSVAIFFVSICDQNGQARTGYVFCTNGSWFTKPETEVKWD